MTNVSVVFEYEEPEYCRLCLSEDEEHNKLSILDEDTIVYIQCLLQIDLDSDNDCNAFICATCFESLEEFYNYRVSCRKNNHILKQKAIDRKQRQIELAKGAIENTNILDQVTDGEPIKMIIHMNPEGKASVRIQVQTRPNADSTGTSNSLPAETSSRSETTIPKAKATTVIPTPVKDSSTKLIQLPMQKYYFYRNPGTKSYGLIYGGYRYYGHVPRSSCIYWPCEQRKSHNCTTMMFVSRTYESFFLNCGHNHDPPMVRPDLTIYKSRDVLHDVMHKERLREQQLELIKKNQKEAETACEKYSPPPEEEMDIKEEPSDDDDEEHRLVSNDSFISIVDPIKEESDSSASSSDEVAVDGGDNLYIIQQLT